MSDLTPEQKKAFATFSETDAAIAAMDDALRIAFAAGLAHGQAERDRLLAERDRLRAALAEIRDMDYRGNHHASASIARTALGVSE